MLVTVIYFRINSHFSLVHYHSLIFKLKVSPFVHPVVSTAHCPTSYFQAQSFSCPYSFSLVATLALFHGSISHVVEVLYLSLQHLQLHSFLSTIYEASEIYLLIHTVISAPMSDYSQHDHQI